MNSPSKVCRRPVARKRDAPLSDATNSISSSAPIRALSLKQVVELTNLSKAYLYELIARGLFPAPAKVGRKSIWDKREVELWLEERFAQRGRQ